VQIVDDPSNELQYLRDVTRPFLAPLEVFGVVLIFTVFLMIEQEDLRDRLTKRNQDHADIIEKRLADAKTTVDHLPGMSRRFGNQPDGS